MTSDKVFLEITGIRKIVFYHLNGAYAYSEFEINENFQLHSDSVICLWKDRRFAHKINGDRSVLLFNFAEIKFYYLISNCIRI